MHDIRQCKEVTMKEPDVAVVTFRNYKKIGQQQYGTPDKNM